MGILVPWLIAIIVALGVVVLSLAILLHRAVERVVETNKQMLILAVAQSGKPEMIGGVGRALAVSQKPPQGKLRGIAPGKSKKKKEPDNVNHTMRIGVK